MRIIIGALLLLTATNAAVALTGVQLYEACQDRNKTALEITCMSYIRGHIDGFIVGLVVGSGGKRPKDYCPPVPDPSLDQFRLIVEKYLRDHPERLNEQAMTLVAESLMTAFPCKNSN